MKTFFGLQSTIKLKEKKVYLFHEDKNKKVFYVTNQIKKRGLLIHSFLTSSKSLLQPATAIRLPTPGVDCRKAAPRATILKTAM